MKQEDKQAVVEEIDNILKSVGFKDYEHARSLLNLMSILCENAAPRLRQMAELSREKLESSLVPIEQSELESGLRSLREFRNYLPTLGATLIRVVGDVFPPQQGGAPQKLKSREDKRNACNQVLALIAKGQSEVEAKKAVAKKLRVSHQTMNRTWKERAGILQPSVEESLLEIFRSLVTPPRS